MPVTQTAIQIATGLKVQNEPRRELIRLGKFANHLIVHVDAVEHKLYVR